MFTIHRLTSSDTPAFRALRLDHLLQHPAGAAAAWEDESVQPDEWFAQRIANTALFGGFLDDGKKLAGIAGLTIPAGSKMRHKGMLTGMYVAPAARGTGMSRALVEAVINHARRELDEVNLQVDPDNHSAIKLYLAAGFTQYGREPRVLKIDGKYRDALLMTLPLHPAALEHQKLQAV